MREAIEDLRRTYDNRKRNVMDRIADVKDLDELRFQQEKYRIYRDIVNDLEEVLAKHDPYNPRQASNVERNDQHGKTE